MRDFYRMIIKNYSGEVDKNVNRIMEITSLIANLDIVSFLHDEKTKGRSSSENDNWEIQSQKMIFYPFDGLYHANSVRTSLSYIREKCIYSRQYGEKHFKAEQTTQKSDPKDKKCGVFNDIFFDNCDTSFFSKRESAYGPITFVFDEKAVLSDESYSIRITKENPWVDKNDWQKLSYSNKYFVSVEELEEYAQNSQFPFRRMFKNHTTIWNQEQLEISTTNLKRIFVERNEQKKLSIDIRNAIINELSISGLSEIPVIIRCDLLNNNLWKSESDDKLWELP